MVTKCAWAGIRIFNFLEEPERAQSDVFAFFAMDPSNKIKFYIYIIQLLYFKFQCMEALQTSPLPESAEILDILNRIEFEGLFFSHDKLAERQVCFYSINQVYFLDLFISVNQSYFRNDED
jgi:hypothetical protein